MSREKDAERERKAMTLIEAIRKAGGAGGGDKPPAIAPPWVHKLVDWLWDYFCK